MGLSGKTPPFLLDVFEGTERAEVRLEKKMMVSDPRLNMREDLCGVCRS